MGEPSLVAKQLRSVGRFYKSRSAATNPCGSPTKSWTVPCKAGSPYWLLRQLKSWKNVALELYIPIHIYIYTIYTVYIYIYIYIYISMCIYI